MSISFALRTASQGCRAYASDLAQRQREHGFTVSVSDDEAPMSADLDGTPHRALRSSRSLVVVANRCTPMELRWVRTEMHAYRSAQCDPAPGHQIIRQGHAHLQDLCAG